MRSERAKIFAPFSPLRGLDAAYREKERIIEKKAELLSDREEEINYKLKSLCAGDIVRVTFYADDAYKKKIGRVSAILPQKRILVLDFPIPFGDIYDIEILTK